MNWIQACVGQAETGRRGSIEEFGDLNLEFGREGDDVGIGWLAIFK